MRCLWFLLFIRFIDVIGKEEILSMFGVGFREKERIVLGIEEVFREVRV